MKIMICIPQLIKGGAERVACNLSNYFVNNDNDVSLVSLRNYKPEYSLDEKVKVKIIDNNIHFNIYRFFNRIVKISKVLGQEKPDIILCFLPEITFYVLFINLFYKKKVIVSVRNDPKVEYKSITRRILMKLLFKYADGFVFQTDDAKKFFSKKIQLKSKIILNSVDKNFIVDKPYSGIRKKEIVTVGRLVSQKNHYLLINAFADIIKDNRFKEYELSICGEGKLKNDLINYCNQLNIKDKVHFKGKIDDIKKEIFSSSVFVLSSDYEGLPNSLIESMALGLPCISTDCPCGGPKMIISNNVNGILVDINDKNGLKNAIKKILSDCSFSKKISNEACRIKEIINPDVINKEWFDYMIYIYNSKRK